MLRFNEPLGSAIFTLACATAALAVPPAVWASCNVTILDARHLPYMPTAPDYSLKYPWPANDGQQTLVGTITMNTAEPVYGDDPRAGTWAPRGSVTRDEMEALLAPVQLNGLQGLGVNLHDVRSDVWVANYGYVDHGILLRTGRSATEHRRVTALRVTQIHGGWGNNRFKYLSETTISDPQLCQKLAEISGPTGVSWFWYNNPNMQFRFRHSLNSQYDTIAVPMNYVFGYQLQKWVKLRTVPDKLIFGSNPAGKTINRDIAIGLSSSIQSRVQYTFSYTSVTNTGEEVLIDGRSLPAQFTVSVPASNITSFTDFKHQVSLTSPDAGKVDGYIRVVAEML